MGWAVPIGPLSRLFSLFALIEQEPSADSATSRVKPFRYATFHRTAQAATCCRVTEGKQVPTAFFNYSYC